MYMPDTMTPTFPPFTPFGPRPTIALYGDVGGRDAAAAAEAGCDVVASLPLDCFAGADCDLAVMRLDRSDAATGGALLDRIDIAARGGRQAGVVILPIALIDLAHARVTHPEVTLLIAPEPAELAEAIARAAAAPRRLVVAEAGGNGEAARLRLVTHEVGRIARQLAALAGDAAPPPHDPGAPPPDGGGVIRGMIRARRLREHYFDPSLFADPAWDILLDLAAARREGREVAVSSLCIAAAVPPTTALRWIRALEEDGLLVRRADANDGRRVFVALSDRAAAAMDEYLAAVARNGG